MAKGNIFLGMGRGSVGDVTFYRGNGQQLSRVRNRKPRNPKTDAQLYQRAIMATIVKAYQAGKDIFDHSFQGYSVGAPNQRLFMSLNAKKLREQIADDINRNKELQYQNGRVIGPSVNSPVPFAYIVSRGTYTQNLFAWDAAQKYFSLSGWSLDDTVSGFAAKKGLIAGDIYTFVVFVNQSDSVYSIPNNDSPWANQWQSRFRWLRFTVKNDLSSDMTVLTKFSQLFDIATDGQLYLFNPDNREIQQNFAIVDFGIPGAEFEISGAIGVIRSRLDMDLRSDTEMIVDLGTSLQGRYGIASSLILDAWRDAGNKVGNSNLILEGGDV